MVHFSVQTVGHIWMQINTLGASHGGSIGSERSGRLDRRHRIGGLAGTIIENQWVNQQSNKEAFSGARTAQIASGRSTIARWAEKRRLCILVN